MREKEKKKQKNKKKTVVNAHPSVRLGDDARNKTILYFRSKAGDV